jgi:hypothetical protein
MLLRYAAVVPGSLSDDQFSPRLAQAPDRATCALDVRSTYSLLTHDDKCMTTVALLCITFLLQPLSLSYPLHRC